MRNFRPVLEQMSGIYWLCLSTAFVGMWALPSYAASSDPAKSKDAKPAVVSPPRLVCATELEPLVAQLVQDLPSYVNRVAQRSRLRRSSYSPSYLLVAGQAEFEPLLLGPARQTPGRFTSLPADDPRQVFITTLERHYSSGKVVELQQYHWLFLTQTKMGWQLAMMFSQVRATPVGQPPSPPRDTSNGATAQAVRLWLRDCQTKTRRSP